MQPDEMACLLLQNGSFPNTSLSYTVQSSTSDLLSLKIILYFCYEMYRYPIYLLRQQ
jgi:hypothetical protein